MKIFRIIQAYDSTHYMGIGHDDVPVVLWMIDEDMNFHSKPFDSGDYETDNGALHCLAFPDRTKCLFIGRFIPSENICSAAMVEDLSLSLRKKFDMKSYVKMANSILKEKFGNVIKIVWFK